MTVRADILLSVAEAQWVPRVPDSGADYVIDLPYRRLMNNADIAEYNNRANNSYLVVLGSFVLCLSDTGIDVELAVASIPQPADDFRN